MSKRPDSGVYMQDKDTMITVLRREAKQWRAKFETEKQEVLHLSGASAKQNRKVQALEKEADALKATVAESNAKYLQKPAIGSLHLKADNRALTDLRVKCDELRTKYDIRNGEAEQLEAQLSQVRTGGHGRDKEVGAFRAQLSDAQRDNEVLRESSDVIRRQLVDAQRQMGEVEEETDGLRRAVEIHHGKAIEADAKAAELEVELLVWKPIDDAPVAVPSPVDDANTDSSYSFSDASLALDLPSLASAIGPQVAPPLMVNSSCQTDTSRDSAQLDPSFVGLNRDVGLIINIAPTTKSWTLLTRVQSAITKSSALDIVGPRELAEEFIAAMNRTAAEHLAASSAAVHWEKMAMQRGSEVVAVRAEMASKPACSVFAHRRLEDELEAKDTQLQIQGSMVARWQKKMDRISVFFEEANVEMRERGVMGV